jgi:hypothetical protein
MQAAGQRTALDIRAWLTCGHLAAYSWSPQRPVMNHFSIKETMAMLIRCTFVYNTEQKRFENAKTESDVLVYVNADFAESGNSIVTAIRNEDRQHFNWVLSDQTTIAGIADIAERLAKAS